MLKSITMWVLFLTLVLLMTFSGCGSDKAKLAEPDTKSVTVKETSDTVESLPMQKTESPGPSEASPKESESEISVSTESGKSAKLPDRYPSDKFPLYEGSYIDSVIEMNGGYTLIAFGKDKVTKVIAFYEKILEGAKVTMDTKTDESLTSFGTKDGYTYNMDVGKSDEMEGYETSITIILQPLN